MLPCKDIGAQRCTGASSASILPKALPRRKCSQRPAAQAPRCEQQQAPKQKLAALLIAAATSATLALAPSAVAREPFLSSTGAKGLLADEEAQLIKLREEKEGQVREELIRARLELEAEAEQSSQGKLCATPFGVDVVGITEAIALTGALVGGYSARQRKQELERLNEQLRKINLQLRQQARAGTLYAPGLTYVPPSVGDGAAAGGNGPAAVAAVAAPASAAIALRDEVVTGQSLLTTMDEEESEEARQCVTALKEGKRFLKEENGASAMVRFEKALMLAKTLSSKVSERRAVRGLAAAARITGQHRTAIKYLERVLEISRETGDNVGDADAYGTIADIYTDIGEFEKAAQYYDLYIGKMASDGTLV